MLKYVVPCFEAKQKNLIMTDGGSCLVVGMVSTKPRWSSSLFYLVLPVFSPILYSSVSLLIAFNTTV